MSPNFVFAVPNLPEHLEIAPKAPERICERSRLILLNEKVADPGEEVSADKGVQDFDKVNCFAKFPSHYFQRELAFSFWIRGPFADINHHLRSKMSKNKLSKTSTNEMQQLGLWLGML